MSSGDVHSGISNSGGIDSKAQGGLSLSAYPNIAEQYIHAYPMEVDRVKQIIFPQLCGLILLQCVVTRTSWRPIVIQRVVSGALVGSTEKCSVAPYALSGC